MKVSKAASLDKMNVLKEANSGTQNTQCSTVKQAWPLATRHVLTLRTKKTVGNKTLVFITDIKADKKKFKDAVAPRESTLWLDPQWHQEDTNFLVVIANKIVYNRIGII